MSKEKTPKPKPPQTHEERIKSLEKTIKELKRAIKELQENIAVVSRKNTHTRYKGH